MFNKVLIAEDHESANISIRKTLEDLEISHFKYAYYCDDALLQVQKGLKDGEPYQLLITDLSFEEDDRPQQLSDGMALIKAVKVIQPNIKVLVFSAESNATIIDQLFKELGINAYVRKARRDIEEIKNALMAIQKDKNYISIPIKEAIQQKNSYQFSEYDIILISLLANGVLQKDIPNQLKVLKIKPCSLSSIEKRLNLIKESLGFTKNEQLIAFSKDVGII